MTMETTLCGSITVTVDDNQARGGPRPDEIIVTTTTTIIIINDDGDNTV